MFSKFLKYIAQSLKLVCNLIALKQKVGVRLKVVCVR